MQSLLLKRAATDTLFLRAVSSVCAWSSCSRHGVSLTGTSAVVRFRKAVRYTTFFQRSLAIFSTANAATLERRLGRRAARSDGALLGPLAVKP